ncbi:S66 family peptidase [Clostridium vincentii]|uniref:Microcin C7 self-immunity protein MccF n=1 Tax=Clostridium vincentii TaxID=52704 RepID=A0A2T0BBB6_9CLOT|nr:S66 peptidase family protein [Clostridium vincentii]PRR81132.1 Microcin C7 self-immunity protein MccF [Clostridium vincentii]
MKCIGIISLSNGIPTKNKYIIEELELLLKSINIKIIKASTIFAVVGSSYGTGQERGQELMKLYNNPTIDGIFDVSGGDLANEVLNYIDFSVIKRNPKPFFGYSDLSVILNSIYSQTNVLTYLYQIRNIVLDKTSTSLNKFKDFIINNNKELFKFNYKWIRGNHMEGILIGGNLRCTLKLSGTKYMPDFKNKIILIESLGGDVSKIITYLTQYKQIGAFDEANGIILGTFTEMEEKALSPSVEDLVLSIVDNPNLPIIKTSEIGHSNTSKGAVIGKYYSFDK